MQIDIEENIHNKNVKGEIIHADARFLNPSIFHKKINYVITSPPYPNEKDYSRTTRLESVILGYIKNKNDLRNIKKQFIRSNTKNIYKEDNDAQYVENISSVTKLSNEIEEKRRYLGKISGFEKLYSSVVKMYFGGMAKHFIDLKAILSDGARLAYVVGDQASYFQIPIRTSQLLGEIAEHHGYKVDSIKTFRKRFATSTESWLNEDILILRYNKQT